MSPQDHPRILTEVSDFADVLLSADGGDLPVVVGGHAVNLWSTYFLSRGAGSLVGFVPFMSKDLDLVGTMELLDRLQRRFKGVVLRSEPRSPVFGRLEIPGKDGGVLKIEVLHTVLGLNAQDLARTIDLQAGAILGRVPMPQLVLKAKNRQCGVDQSGGKTGREAREDDDLVRGRFYFGTAGES